jgi:RHS repeat-associated protein
VFITTVIDYAYDPLYRLIAADYDSGQFFHYGYDAVGNRLLQETHDATNVYAYDAANRLVEVDGVAYAWDANGNLLSDGERTYTYDHANRLTALSDQGTLYTYAYNGLGDRLQQSVDGLPTDYVLDLNAGLTQVLEAGTNAYLYGLNRIGEVQRSAWQYHLADALGSVRQIVDYSATVGITQSYDPFGVTTASAGNLSSSFGFTSEQHDPTDLVFLRARYYDPSTGRIIQRDPLRGISTLPQTQNPYTYVVNNPVLHTDPSGKILPLLIFGAFLGAGIEYGIQVYQNMKNCGMDLFDAVYYKNLNLGRIGLSGLEGALMSLAGGVTGSLIKRVGWTGLKALGAAALSDIGFGTLWDLGVYGHPASEAFVRNIISFGFGEAIGYAGRGILSSVNIRGLPKIDPDQSAKTLFDPSKLERIIKNLELEGVSFEISEEVADSLKRRGLGGSYFWRETEPGLVFLPPNPSSPAVIEELIHVGQHRSLGWGAVPREIIVTLEIEAQQKLLDIGKHLNWSSEEIIEIGKALDSWLSKLK